jgi:glyoxylase-like metal-dependent hydrolase (beta-lactamase superfamily II)
MGGLIHDGALEYPNAIVHVAKADVDFFGDRSNAAKAHYGTNYFDDYFASLKHYVDAGKVQTFEGTTEIAPGISATVHPGHTPGSTFYAVESDGQKIVFAEFARDRTLIAFPHIPFPGIGHVRTSGTGYEWAPIIYGNRDITKKWQ